MVYSTRRAASRASNRTRAAESDARLLASASRSLAYVPNVDRELREARDAERSTVVRGGSFVALVRDRRTPGRGIVRRGSISFVRVGGERSDARAVATLRRDGRTVRVGASESFAEAV